MFDFQLNTTQLLSWGLPILFSAVLSFIFATIYVLAGQAHSSRRRFSRNFMPMAIVTTAIIMVIKQSIALSLGLVGALSIVRFRAAIKEPEEIIYLFMMIAIGVGAGAGEIGLTFVFSFILAAVLLGRHYFSSRKAINGTFNVNIISKKAKGKGPESLIAILNRWCTRVALKRFDENGDKLDALFFAEFKDESSLSAWRNELLEFDSEAVFSFLDQEEMF